MSEAQVARSHLRWTMDELEEFEFARLVYERLYPVNANVTTLDILDLIEREPAIQAMNAGVR